MGPNEIWVLTTAFDLEKSLFVLTIKNNAKLACKNHLILTCLPSFGGPFYDHKFLNIKYLSTLSWLNLLCGSYWFSRGWTVFSYAHLYEKWIKKSIECAFVARHLNVQPKVFHHQNFFFETTNQRWKDNKIHYGEWWKSY